MIDNPPMHEPSHLNGVLSLAFFAKNIRAIRRKIPPEYSKFLTMGDTARSVNWAHMRNVLGGIPEIAAFFPGFSYKRFVRRRKIPSLVLKNRANTYSIHYHAEQAPNPESKVFLSDERDMFGVPRLVVDYRISEIDLESIYRAHVLIDRQLRKQGCGYLTFDKETQQDVVDDMREQVGVGGHHIGTTPNVARTVAGRGRPGLPRARRTESLHRQQFGLPYFQPSQSHADDRGIRSPRRQLSHPELAGAVTDEQTTLSPSANRFFSVATVWARATEIGRAGGLAAMGKGAATVADQAVASATNFVTSVIIGRACSKDELGFYMLGFTIMLFANGHATGADSFALHRLQRQAGWRRASPVHGQLSDPPIGPVQCDRSGSRSLQCRTVVRERFGAPGHHCLGAGSGDAIDSASRVCTPGKLRALAGRCGPFAGLLCVRRADRRFAPAGAFRGTLVEPGILVDRRGVRRDLAGVASLVATRVCLFARPGPS